MNVSVQILDAELLIWVFVFLHEYSVFNLLIPLSHLEIPGEDDFFDKQHEMLESNEKE